MTVNRVGQIVAMGGGGFSMEPENPLLDDYILGLARRERPKICFIPTASSFMSAGEIRRISLLYGRSGGLTRC